MFRLSLMTATFGFGVAAALAFGTSEEAQQPKVKVIQKLIQKAKDADKPAEEVKAVPAIGHMVFFKLKDRTPEARAKLVAACDKYLAKHEGTVYYSAGVIAEEFKREVNDLDFDVALHLVFATKAAHDKYQDHPDHLKFIEENKDSWAKVRVFDSNISKKTPQLIKKPDVEKK